jgi:hypothetical protein
MKAIPFLWQSRGLPPFGIEEYFYAQLQPERVLVGLSIGLTCQTKGGFLFLAPTARSDNI